MFSNPFKKKPSEKLVWQEIEDTNLKEIDKKKENPLQTCIDSSGNIDCTAAQKILTSEALVPVAALSELILIVAKNMYQISCRNEIESELNEKLADHTALIRLALKKASDQNTPITDWKQSTSGDNALHYAVKLHHLELLQALCTHDPQIVKLKNGEKLTALEIAFNDMKKEIAPPFRTKTLHNPLVELLVHDRESFTLLFPDLDFNVSLEERLSSVSIAVTTFYNDQLISKNSNSNEKQEVTISENSIALAIYCQYSEFILAILTSPSTIKIDQSGFTRLFAFVFEMQNKVIKKHYFFLALQKALQQKIDITLEPELSDYALYLATDNNDTQLFKFILANHQQNKTTNILNQDRWEDGNPLFRALHYNNLELIALMVKHGTDALFQQKHSGKTILEYVIDIFSKKEEKQESITAARSQPDNMLSIFILLLSREKNQMILNSAYLTLYLNNGPELVSKLLTTLQNHRLDNHPDFIYHIVNQMHLKTGNITANITLAKLIFDRGARASVHYMPNIIEYLVQLIEQKIAIDNCLPMLIEFIQLLSQASSVDNRSDIENCYYIRVFKQLMLHKEHQPIIKVLTKHLAVNLHADNELVALALKENDLALATELLKHQAQINFAAIPQGLFILTPKLASDKIFIAFMAALLAHDNVDKDRFIFLFNKFVEDHYDQLALIALKVAKDRDFILTQATLFLHQTIQCDQTDLALELLAFHRDQIDVNAEIHGKTALLLAIENNNEKLVTFMLDHADQLKMNEKAVGLTEQAQTPKTTATSSMPYSCRFLTPCRDQSIATILMKDTEMKLVQELKELIFACSNMQQLVINSQIKTNKYAPISTPDSESEKEALTAFQESKSEQEKHQQNLELEKGLAIQELVEHIHQATTCQDIIKIVKDEDQKIHRQLNKPSNTIGWMLASVKNSESAKLFAAFKLEFSNALNAHPRLKEMAAVIKEKKRELGL